jgi:hypothetical protein
MRDRRDLALALGAIGWGFFTVMGREQTWLMPLVILLIAFALASCLPNPTFDGRAASRDWVARLRSMRQP